jgi:hypothetical protein
MLCFLAICAAADADAVVDQRNRRDLGWYAIPDLRFTEYVDNGAVPEPASAALFGLGLVGLAALSRKRLTAQ